MQTRTINLYTIDELSDEAKEKARGWYRESNDYTFLEEDMHEFLLEELDRHGYEVKELEGLYYSLAYCQGDGASFAGVFTRDNKTYYVKQSGHYVHEMTMELEIQDEEGEGIDDTGELEELREIARAVEKHGYAHIDEENSEEYIDEALRANDYLFTQSGKVWEY